MGNHCKHEQYQCCTSHKNYSAQNEVALSYHRVRGLYFLTVIFAATIINEHGYGPVFLGSQLTK